jgi:hypothetical protein
MIDTVEHRHSMTTVQCEPSHELCFLSRSMFVHVDVSLDIENSSTWRARVCSVTLADGVESIGISLQSDRDVGHKIKHVEFDSPAQRAGIRDNDCIVALNKQSLLRLPYEDVLELLKTSRKQRHIELTVMQKCLLKRLFVNQRQSNGTDETFGSSERAGAGPTGTTIDEQDCAVETRHGRIQRGIGPAVTNHSTWQTTERQSSDHVEQAGVRSYRPITSEQNKR